MGGGHSREAQKSSSGGLNSSLNICPNKLLLLMLQTQVVTFLGMQSKTIDNEIVEDCRHDII